MEIRYTRPEDLEEIIAVLKASLGEVSSKKNSEIWNFKHEKNPFGKSLVLVAIEKEKIVGVRAFMRWEWQLGNQKFRSFRAVDTATHPDHRGKGIFKKLTLEAVSQGAKNEDHFIFNTPNSQSRPGYLKMGWEEVDKIKVELLVANPYQKSEKLSLKINEFRSLDTVVDLLNSFHMEKIAGKKFFTPKTIEYLNWRYINNPLQQYMISFDEDYFCAAYIKKHKYFKELRVSEAIFVSQEGQQKVKGFLRKAAAAYGALIISKAADENKMSLFSYKGKLGPILTIRQLKSSKESLDFLRQLDNWRYSLGDLELF